jgi:hypothetical protein
MLPLRLLAPVVSLPDVDGRWLAVADASMAPALVVMFLCNHVPFGNHRAAELGRFAREGQAQGAAVVAINSNDAAAYPEDVTGRVGSEPTYSRRADERSPL